MWSEVDLAKIRVYGIVSDYGTIGSSKASKGKGPERVTATRSVLSVLKSEGTVFVRRG